MITAYIWTPRGAAYGHASLRITGGTPLGEAYVSYWPMTPGSTKLFCSMPSRNRTLEQDVSGEDGQRPHHQITLDGLNETAIKAWWHIQSARRDADADWCTVTRNCSTIVAESLRVGGADYFVSPIAWDSWNAVWNPHGVLMYVTSLQRALASRARVNWEAVAARGVGAQARFDRAMDQIHHVARPGRYF